MKRLIRACIVFLVVTSPFCLGCVDSSDYGGPVDIVNAGCVWYDADGKAEVLECALPSAVISDAEDFDNKRDMAFTFVNYSLNRVRLNRMTVEYTAPWGPAIPNHVQTLAVDIKAADAANPEAGGEEKEVAVSIWSLEQTRHISERRAEYPATPFLVHCKVTFFYNTSGGQEQSLEREVTIELL
jgi:hypothetical protein